MKNAKKVLAMVIVLALAISMAIPASAAVDVTINQSDSSAQAGAVYTYWKIADLSYAEGGAYRYTVTEDWKDFVEAHDGVVEEGEPAEVQFFDYNSDTGVITEFSNDGIAISTAAEAWAKDNEITGTETSGAVNKKVTIKDLEDGYYLLASSLGTKLMLDTVLNSTDGNKDIEIDEKNEIPTIDKTVRNVTDNETTADKATDAAIGEILEYTITVTKTDGAIGYVVEDTLSRGLEFVDDSEEVTVDYTLGKDGNKLIFTLDDVAVAGVANGAPITITYQVRVTKEATIDNANANSAILKYGKNSQFSTKEVKANAYVWSFDLLKYTGENVALPGAEFRLYANEGCTEEIKFVYVGNIDDVDVYRVAEVGETGAGVVISSTTGKYDLQGLDAGTYYLKETKAPDGYNFLTTPTTVAIGATEENDVTLKSTVNGVENGVVKVQNNTGAILPETGGTGTVIFVVVGSFLVLAMGVLLVVRKRMSKVVYTR